jgi:hypothetical protein
VAAKLPVDGQRLSRGQAEHEDCIVNDWKLPALHEEHCAAEASAYWPALQEEQFDTPVAS